MTLGQVVEINRRLLEGYDHFKDEPRVQNLRQDVLKYNRLVRDLGLRDHQVSVLVSFFGLSLTVLPGTPCAKSKLENSRTPDISRHTPSHLDDPCVTWHYIECPYSYRRLCDIQKKGER